MKTILEICKEVADLAAVQRPDDLFSAENQNDQIWLSVAKSELDSLMRYGNWQELTKEAILLTNSSQTIYPLDMIAPDFYCLLQNTVYIKDQAERVIGAITPEQWARDKCFKVNDDVSFIIQNNRIKFLNNPSCWKILLMYRSSNIVWDFNTFEEKTVLEKNTDVPIFDEYLVKLGILWRWLKRSGLDYTEEYNEYQRELKKRFGVGLATKDIALGSEVFADMGDIANVIVSKTSE